VRAILTGLAVELRETDLGREEAADLLGKVVEMPALQTCRPEVSSEAERWRAVRDFVHRHDVRSGGRAAKMHDDDVESTVLDVLRRVLSERKKRAPALAVEWVDDVEGYRDDPTDPNGDKDGVAEVDSVAAHPPEPDLDPPGNDDDRVVEREQEFVPIETSTVVPDGWVPGPGASFVESATGATLEWLASARRWFVDNGRSGLDHQRERMEQERDPLSPPFAAASLRAQRPTFPHLMESHGDRVLDEEKRVIASPRPGEPPVPTRGWDDDSWRRWNQACDRVRALTFEVEAAGWTITTL
jgi:hypothetical protein